MIAFADALAAIDRAARPYAQETVPVAESLGRFLTEALTAPTDVPAFSRSAMDGFALRREDLGRELRVVETIAAGQVAEHDVKPGTAVRIMTGAQVPRGADLVVQVEFTEERDGYVRFTQTEQGTNIIERGENAKAGDVVVTPRLMGAQDVGVAAAHGRGTLAVMQAPQVGVIATGNELREPGCDLGPGEIHNSNGPQLMAHSRTYGCAPRYYGIGRDSPAELRELLASALAENDLVVVSGGVSRGEFDYVPELMGELGVQTHFHRVAMKPGRPTYFGTRGGRGIGEATADRGAGRQTTDRRAGEPTGSGSSSDITYVFGLPGNPVSVFVVFEVFVRRLLHRMAGLEPAWRTVPVLAGETLPAGDAERVKFIPVSLHCGAARPVRYGGSSHLSALSDADGLVEIPVGAPPIAEGSPIDVRPI